MTVDDFSNMPLTLENMMLAFDARMTRYEEDSERRRVERDREAAERKAEREEEAAKRKEEDAKQQKVIEEIWTQIRANAKQITDNSKQIGGMGNSNGDFAQECFFNALYYRKTLFGQKFDKVERVKRKITATGMEVEFDIMLVNGTSVCIVEVKYKADTDDVKKIFSRIEKLFRELFPEHADKTLYLALASMSFDTRVEKACLEAGIAMIKQKGDTIEVYDEHLKAF